MTNVQNDPQTAFEEVVSEDDTLMQELESYAKNGALQKEMRDNTAVKNLDNATEERKTSKARIAEICGKILNGKEGVVRCGPYTVIGKTLAEAPVDFVRKGKYSVSISGDDSGG